MNEQNKLDNYINSHPRQSLQLFLIGICLIWQSVVCVMGVILYMLFAKLGRIQWWLLLVTGVLCAVAITAVDFYPELASFTLPKYIAHGFSINFAFWKQIVTGKDLSAWIFLYQQGTVYWLGVPLLFAGILSATDLIQDNPHQKIIKALQEGKHIHDREELSDKNIESALKKINDESATGTILGISKYTGEKVVIPDFYINQIALALGTTGSGKTITLRRFYQRAMIQGYPLIIVDGKPTDENVTWLQAMAKKYNRPFYGFNCGNYSHYDTLSNGGYTELKDKIISLKDKWENDYYRSIAEDYLQTTFEVLLQSKKTFDLKQVAECLNHDELLIIAREMGNEVLLKRVADLVGYDHKDITGLKAHLNLLIHSELGKYFSVDENMFSLPQIIAENAIVYFALPALRFPSFSTVLGKLVINDLKATIDRGCNDKCVFMVFDEFSVFAGDQVLNLVNMGRGKGVHAIFGTQGLSDLNKVDNDFKNQVLNCVNTIICHRLNDQDSAEAIAAWIGTKDAFTVTAQVDVQQGADGRLGTVRVNKEYIVHPEEIKQGLQVGEAFYVSKVRGVQWEKVRVRLV